MRLFPLRSATLAVLIALAVGRVAPVAAQASVEVHTGISAGPMLGQGLSDPGFALLAWVDLWRAGSRLGVRGELMYTRSSYEEHALFSGPCAQCTDLSPFQNSKTTEQSVAALLGVTYRLTSGRRAYPYLIGEIGMFRLRSDMAGRFREECSAPEICTMSLIPSFRQRLDGTRPGVNVGLGGALPLGSAELTAEARVPLLYNRLGTGRLYPLTLGIRF